MKTTKRIALLLIAWACVPATFAQTNRLVSLEQFIEAAGRNDTEFDEILIQEVALRYAKALRLPARDLVLSVKEEYVSFLDDNREDPATSIGLSKLFPFTGTEAGLTYEVRPTAREDTDTPSRISFTLAQPIARNAFGRSTRMLDQIIGLEVDVARHQVVEAYEDYLATIMVAYYEWWAAHENLQIGQSSYRENLRLLDNILERQKQQIALPIDVNKTRLQLLAKQEDLVELANTYTNRLHDIERIIRHDGSTPLTPQTTASLPRPNGPFQAIYQRLRTESRTFQILELLEERGQRDVDRQAEDLLPSIDLLFAAEWDGQEHDLRDSEGTVSLGLALRWPLTDQVNKAEAEVAKIDLARTRLATENTHQRLYTRLKNLDLQIRRERKLTAIADEKIELAKAVLADETKNYSFGRVTLNDYIVAVNVLDNNRFNRLRHDVLGKVLTVEWLRLTDQLISREEIPDREFRGVPKTKKENHEIYDLPAPSPPQWKGQAGKHEKKPQAEKAAHY